MQSQKGAEPNAQRHAHSCKGTHTQTHTHTGHQQSTKHNKAYFEAHLFESKNVLCLLLFVRFPLKRVSGISVLRCQGEKEKHSWVVYDNIPRTCQYYDISEEKAQVIHKFPKQNK